MTHKRITTCKNDPKTDPYCPVFLVSDILQKTEPDSHERNQMLIKVFVFLYIVE
jgi:hypothetical protein